MNKKALTWDIIAKVVLALITLLIIFLVIMKTSDRSFGLVEKLKNLFAFGG